MELLMYYIFQYENQLYAGKWVSNGLTVPPWSDIQGKISLPQANFTPPQGWRWDGDWKIVSDVW